MEKIPFVVLEATMARLERTIKRMWILCIILTLLLVGTNLAWLMYENSFSEFEIVQETEGGYNNFIGNDGDIHNGKADNNN